MMFVNDVAPRVKYTATSGQTVFDVPFEFLANGDLEVIVNGATITYSATPVLVSEYSVTGAGTTGGGRITLGAGATLADEVVIIRSMPFERLSDFPTGGPFLIPILNAELDRYMLLMRQLEELFARALQVPATDLSSDLRLPNVATRASKWLAFDESGVPMAVSENGQSVVTGTARAVTQTVVTATNGQTSIAVVYEVGTIIVTLNGLIVPPSDYTATSGAQVVFGTGLSVGDTVIVIQLSAS